MHEVYFRNGSRFGWWVLLVSWLLFGVSFLLLSYYSSSAHGGNQFSLSLCGWQCAYASLHAFSPGFLPTTLGLRIYIAGFTAVNLLGALSYPLAFIRSVRRSLVSLVLLLLAAGYASSWFLYLASLHEVGDLRLGYYVWTLSLWGMTYGLARGWRHWEHPQPIMVAEETQVWPPPPTVRR